MIDTAVANWMASASKEDLDQLIDLAREKRDFLTKTSFSIGDEVWFDAKTRGIVRGKIVKMNNKTAKVLATTGLQWSVSPIILHKGTI